MVIDPDASAGGIDAGDNGIDFDGNRITAKGASDGPGGGGEVLADGVIENEDAAILVGIIVIIGKIELSVGSES